eukprot:CAMPEP_0198209038 /NCGR_PEP_ID=MMETSP1445-20131203/12362_1 /TAXON_ID=36898 /ORGANISM="Pyramimonas sp., Strain CCMP2087" /LENGTH=162 /DNA_ID=CAMNT_0043882665 /DNA_START=84 /DNA_END=572 /DNA_ORIENTATION=-
MATCVSTGPRVTNLLSRKTFAITRVAVTAQAMPAPPRVSIKDAKFFSGSFQQKQKAHRCTLVSPSRATNGATNDEGLPDIVPEAQPVLKMIKPGSICCERCNGDGDVDCSKCDGTGVNAEDVFGGRFKKGDNCWLCRGQNKMTCGDCNGGGFVFKNGWVEDD